jgi:mono/diheme cytochrome c family protein
MRMSTKVVGGVWLFGGIFMGDVMVGHAGENTKAGQELFLAHCQHCHGAQGEGNGEFADYLDPPPADLRSARTQARTDEELRTIIMEGRPGTKMTGYEIFEDDEIINLVIFIRSLGK